MKLDFPSIGGPNGAARRFDHLLLGKPSGQLDDAGRIVRVGLIAGASFFGLLLLFSLLVPLSGAAVASGEVTTSGTRIVVQPAAGGVVSEILVTEGQLVRKGQPLVRLNGVKSAAAAQQAQAKRDALRALQARLVAERDGQEQIAFPEDLTRRAMDPVVASVLQSQSAIFTRHRDVLLSQRQMAETEQRSAEAQRAGAGEQLALINDELGSVQTLYNKGFARKSQLRSLQRAAAELNAEQLTGQAAVAKTTLMRAQIANQQMMDTVAELGKVEEQLAQVDPALRVTRYDADRDTLRAAVDGRVSGVARLGPGSVVGAGTTVMEIVPNGRALIVETVIKPTDIDDVHIGSAATLRFTTINPRSHGSFPGHVVSLSPARVPGQNGASGFRAQVALDNPGELQREKISLQPGVPVVVQIKTHSRTLFNYLFAPVEDAMSGAFREE